MKIQLTAIALALALAIPCLAGSATDLPAPDRVLLEEASIFLWFSKNVSEGLRPDRIVWLVKNFTKRHAETRDKMVKAYPKLYEAGTPSIASLADPTVANVYSSSCDLAQRGFARLEAIVESRGDEESRKAFQSLIKWRDTAIQIKNKDPSANKAIDSDKK